MYAISIKQYHSILGNNYFMLGDAIYMVLMYKLALLMITRGVLIQNNFMQ